MSYSKFTHFPEIRQPICNTGISRANRHARGPMLGHAQLCPSNARVQGLLVLDRSISAKTQAQPMSCTRAPPPSSVRAISRICQSFCLVLWNQGDTATADTNTTQLGSSYVPYKPCVASHCCTTRRGGHEAPAGAAADDRAFSAY